MHGDGKNTAYINQMLYMVAMLTAATHGAILKKLAQFK
jgi:hypothetical protein